MVRVDFPGFGAAPAREPVLDELGRAALLVALLDELGIVSVTALGHSVGGAVATALASLAPTRVTGLALVATAGARPHLGFRLTPFRSLVVGLRYRWLRGATRVLLRQWFSAAGFPRRLPLAELEETTLAAAKVDFAAHGARIAALKLPTLLAWARDDRIVEARVIDELAPLCGPGARLRFEAGGHNLQKTKAVEIGAALKAWLLPPA